MRCPKRAAAQCVGPSQCARSRAGNRNTGQSSVTYQPLPTVAQAAADAPIEAYSSGVPPPVGAPAAALVTRVQRESAVRERAPRERRFCTPRVGGRGGATVTSTTSERRTEVRNPRKRESAPNWSLLDWREEPAAPANRRARQ
eukprot:scaffold3352_cov326-Prasinococcus_capsulatus_cf.AAC.8